MPSTIFIVEDDLDIARLIAHHVDSAGYVARVFDTGAGVLDSALKSPPALFLLDVMLPGFDGIELCRRIRATAALELIPVILLTARTAEADRITGLESGADDYISKPFSPRELLARIQAVQRRTNRTQPPAVVRFGDVKLDTSGHRLTVRGTPVEITATEFRLLDYLIDHPNRVFSRAQLLDAVWGSSAVVTERSVDVYVRRIREKIEPDPDNPEYIKTFRGAGYLFELKKA